MCPTAMGFAFAVGTNDRPGAFDFTQGDDQLVGGLLKKQDKKQIKGQDLKPILIDSGEMHEPYDWAYFLIVLVIVVLLICGYLLFRLLLLFRIDALFDFFHMVIFSLMVDHTKVLWVGLGFVFIKQKDEDDDGGVILRLDKGMNGINVLDHVEVFGRDRSFPNDTLHVMPVEVFWFQTSRSNDIYNLLGDQMTLLFSFSIHF
nr:neutral/alkaline nonlysosomal ceramidase [Tanacetum cinerariifolium]